MAAVSQQKKWTALIPASPLVVAFAVTVWRATTLSITHDEAWTYDAFVRPGFQAAFHYDQNNHVLNSLLMHVSTALFGVSELTLRLPVILGAAIFGWSLWRLCVLLLPRMLDATLLAALIGWNPLLLDYFCVARGYGLGLGFLALALFLLVRDLKRHIDGVGSRWPGVVGASLALGLCCCSNTSLFFIAGGLVVGYLLGILLTPTSSENLSVIRTIGLVSSLAVPGLVATWLLLRPVFKGMTDPQIYRGVSSPLDTIRDQLNATFYRSETSVFSDRDVQSWPNLSRPDTPTHRWLMDSGTLLLCGLALLLMASVLTGTVLWLRQPARPAPRIQSLTAWLLSSALVINGALYWMAHEIRGVPYPTDRHAIYLVPLFLLLAGVITVFPTWYRALFVIAGIGVLATSLVRWDPRYTRTWRFDAGAERVVEAIEQAHTTEHLGSVVIGSSWVSQPALDFYRLRRKADWMAPCDRAPGPDPRKHDFFVYATDDLRHLNTRFYRDIYVDPISDEHVAERLPNAMSQPFPGR